MLRKFRKGSAAVATPIEREFDPSTVEGAPPPVEQSELSYWGRRVPVIACGAGLFADGYLNSVRTRSRSFPGPY